VTDENFFRNRTDLITQVVGSMGTLSYIVRSIISVNMQCAKETLELELYSRTEQVKNGNYILGKKLQSWVLGAATRIDSKAAGAPGVISSVSAKASIVCSPLIRKVFSRSKNCASACQRYGDANTRTTPNSRRLLISQSAVQP
jgi:hypothetical protein